MPASDDLHRNEHRYRGSYHTFLHKAGTPTPMKQALARAADPLEQEIGVDPMLKGDRRNRRVRRRRLGDNALSLLSRSNALLPAARFHQVSTSTSGGHLSLAKPKNHYVAIRLRLRRHCNPRLRSPARKIDLHPSVSQLTFDFMQVRRASSSG